ncbi:energy transducer TonB family protein [Desertivirga xinjiangensis]|uniref:energy transducer TonB family protein n=1 Tax=Desertivirga xinjiangensis TaxID=539206 RepID=UPI00210C0700|nr:energy transducer TonB [Pedobacter xinjiangensis]
MLLNYLTFIFSLFLSYVNLQDRPAFKGGKSRLDSFIANTIIYPEYSKFNCLQGSVLISFQLDHTGRIFNSGVEKGFGLDLDDEALRVIRLTSGKWIVPASFDTTQFLSIPINFSLREYDCESRSKEEIKEAINAYKAREELSNAVINFYSQKDTSKTREGELRILELKEQLGYNDTFIERVIRQANQKLKQGDKESACEDFLFIRRIGSDKADKLLALHCQIRK